MRVEVIPIDFLGQGALLEPADQKLHDLAVEYCRRELQDGDTLNLAKFTKCWVVVEVENGEYGSVVGISGFVWRLDIPVFRVSGENAVRATQKLTSRLRNYFQDIGARGQEAFLHISSKEKPEQRCQKWDESLTAVGAVPADRFSVKI